MNSEKTEKKKARKLLKLLKDKIYRQVHFGWSAVQSAAVANWIRCQNKLRIEPSLIVNAFQGKSPCGQKLNLYF